MSTGTRSMNNMHAGDHPVVQSAVIMRETLRLPTMFNMLTRSAKKLVTTRPDSRSEADKEAPVVVVNDLTTGAGSEVEIFLHHDIGGKPIMGTKDAEGRGSQRTRSSWKVKINRYTKGVKDGDVYDYQERGYHLKGFNKSDLGKYYRELNDQLLIVHLAGTRGHYQAKDWHVPLETDVDFAEIMVNPVVPPTNYRGGDGLMSRHFFTAGKDSISGGAAPLVAGDHLTLNDFRHWKACIEEMPNPIEPVDLSPSDDPYRFDPLYVAFVSPRGWADLAMDEGTDRMRELQAMAFNRATMMSGKKEAVHPIFRGDCILVDDILIRKMPYPVRFLPGMKTKMSDPDRKERTLVDQMIAANADYCVERGFFVGGEAIGMAFGNTMAKAKKADGENMMARNFRFLDAKYDYGRKTETAIEWVKGMGKITFRDEDCTDIDRGVIAFDYVTRLKC